ncbi:tetratricopeptide repeat protein [Limnohabitans sp.]|uniref:tetratricopeptide repeat protein n=1 Tax=Limnohabitans sp. TaxID=1907725 RepID=UPI002AFFE79A|nr:tetratricopeptide repeat protein [Limnohabitans sp.]
MTLQTTNPLEAGKQALQTGDLAAAEAALAQAAEQDPDSPEVALLWAQCAVRRGEVRTARERFAALLRQHPTHFRGWLEAGHLSRQLGRQAEVMHFYRMATQVAPTHWEGWLTLAGALEAAGQWDEAAACYHRALPLATQATEGEAVPVSRVHASMAKIRLERGDAARALESLRQALGLMRVEKPEPDVNVTAALQIDLGDALMRLGLTEAAHRAFERASAATSEEVLTRLAMQSFHHNLWEEAQAVLKRNVALHPGSALALWNLAHSYVESWQMDEALQTLAQAEAIAPQPGAKSMRASVAGRLGDADQALALYRELAEEEGPESAMLSSAAMSALYSDSLTAQEVADLHRSLFAGWGKGARPVAEFANARESGKRIKLGLLSADFHHQHPVNIFMQPVLARLDKSQFEVTLYNVGMAHDDQTQQAQRRVDHWVQATSWTPVQLARRMRDDGIDVLIDLAGHTSHNRLLMLSQRVAPVQVSFLGYPGSTGVPNIDWLLADPVVVPPAHDALCTERVHRLPNTVFCFAPEADYPYPVYGQAQAQRPLTFGSFNNVPKLTPHTIALWAKVLARVPGSRLLLKAPSFRDESAIRIFRERFVQQGVDASRIEFRGPVGLADMMAEYADVDIALDPVPYNGGTTTLQALWMGVPVVVKEGQNFVSRMGASFMRAAGLPDWVAASDEAYVEIAARMAADRQALLQLKAGLRARLQAAPAWDVDQYTRDMESALRAMWTDHCQP